MNQLRMEKSFHHEKKNYCEQKCRQKVLKNITVSVVPFTVKLTLIILKAWINLWTLGAMATFHKLITTQKNNKKIYKRCLNDGLY